MKSRLILSTMLIVPIVTFGLVTLKYQQIQDWWKLRGYTPPSNVIALANDDTMNSYTKHLFYLNKPRLPSTVTAFRQYCPENEDTIVLGCYHPDQDGIYIFAVQDPTLAGIQQVTAAHEVLHAVYARLSNPERNKLDTELEAFYQHGLTDSNVKSEVALYKKTEPNDVYDEMSCTFGTEISNLPPSLNSYYAQFFTNRQRIVAYEEQYQVQFTSRQQQVDQYDEQLSTMKTQINSEQAMLKAEDSSLNAQDANLQTLLANGQTEAYDTSVDSYNSKVVSYNADVAALKLKIIQYNQLVVTRNAVAGQLTTLDSAIDTRVPSSVAQ